MQHRDAPAGMPLIQDVTGCISSNGHRHGLNSKQLAVWLDRAAGPLANLQADCETGSSALLSVVDETADLDTAAVALDRLCAGASTVVFFGTGGSSLGGQTLCQIAGWNIPGEAVMRGRDRPRVRFFDNLDPRSLAGSLATLDLERTRFVVISKSGGTAETLMQCIAAMDVCRKAGMGARLPDLFLGVTEPARAGVKNGLRDLLAAHGVPLLEHHTGIGGRYSALTNTGLIPLMVMGRDPYAVRNGARQVRDRLIAAAAPQDFAPALGASIAIGLTKEHGIRNSVLLPYSDRLMRFSAWFVQLWAESLGKGGEGTTPVAATGPVDQHSQLQLWMDGPPEVMITVIRERQMAAGPVMPADLAELAGAHYLSGRSVGDLVDAQAHAVPDALLAAGRPVRIIEIAPLDETTMGALMMHFMLETILAGALLGIDPFDQPGVEAGKRLTRERLA